MSCRIEPGPVAAYWQSLPYVVFYRTCEIQMPTRNISLTAEQDAFVQEVVEAGEYQNASEAIRDALRVLQQRRKEDGLRLKALRAQIRVGVEALDRGDFAEIEDADLEGHLERLATTPAAKRVR
jgi:antitoxin ParD1/3/4